MVKDKINTIQFTCERDTFRFSSSLLDMKSPLKPSLTSLRYTWNHACKLPFRQQFVLSLLHSLNFLAFILLPLTPFVPSQAILDVTCGQITCIRLISPKISIFCTLIFHLHRLCRCISDSVSFFARSPTPQSLQSQPYKSN